MEQAAQIVGALLILAAFGGVQSGKMHPRALPALLLNLSGALILTIVALGARDWGFVLLEGVWSIVSAAGLVAALRAR